MESTAGPGSKKENHRVTRAAGVVGAATLLSRVFGYARDMVMASFFGAGMTADAFKSVYGFLYCPVALKLVSKKPNLSTVWFAISDVFKVIRHVAMITNVFI